jgi:hypothetical protein
MLAEVKKCIESKDIKGLHYIFVDSLDVDPTFEKYNEDYEYCKGINGFLEPHVDITPFSSSEKWNEKYWVQIKMDLMKNFSEKRFSHMREVVKVIYSEKIKRLELERERLSKKNQEVEKNQKEQMARIQADRQKDNASANKSFVVTSQILDAEKAQKERLEEKHRAIELHNQEVEKKQKEQMARIQAARQKDKESKNNKSYVETPKKATGAVTAAVVIIAIILIIVLIIVL